MLVGDKWGSINIMFDGKDSYLYVDGKQVQVVRGDHCKTIWFKPRVDDTMLVTLRANRDGTISDEVLSTS